MVQYEDKIETHRDLHTRGCKIQTSKRRIDLDERYRQDEGMKCTFRQEDDKCVCYRCRTEKCTEKFCSFLPETLVVLVKPFFDQKVLISPRIFQPTPL